MPKPNTPPRAVAIAALTVDIGQGDSAPVDFRLIPAGEFRARDGRPTECAAWICDEADGRRILAALSAQADKAVIDYEHATLHARKKGTQAPAAGWFKNAEWRDDGIWLVGVDWTAAAASLITSKEYRYVSPVFSYDKKTGHVLEVFHAALTNFAGLDGLTDLAALAAEVFDNQPQTETPPMNEELLEKWRWILNLPEGATEADILAQLNKVIEQIKSAGGEAVAANSFDLAKFLADSQTQVAALTAQVSAAAQPDPAKFVPIAVVNDLRTSNAALSAQLSELSAGSAESELDRVVTAALSAGKITPAMESWARDLGKKDMAALSSYIDSAPVAVTPGKSQTQGVAPAGNSTGIAALSAEQKAVAAQLGISETDFAQATQA